MSGAVVSVGSLNLDITIAVPRLPRPGETVVGGASERGCGGKGANQAAAAAAAGATVAMVGRVGDDDAGAMLIDDLVARGIDVGAVARTAGRPSGSAVVAVDVTRAENLIIVDPGANGDLRPADVELPAVRDAAVVVAQLEVPMETVVAAAACCNGMFVLNPAPAAALPSELARSIDVLVANQSEIAMLAGTAVPDGLEQVAATVRALAAPYAVIVSAGAAGAVVSEPGAEAIVQIPAPAVDAVDTTGAGDCLCGVLAARLAAGDGLVDAARMAVVAASLSTRAPGARGALPGEAEIRAVLAAGVDPRMA